MLNPRLAGRYAKSLLTLAIEKNQLDTTYQDMEFLNAVSKANKEFVVVLKSPVISPEKKEAIIEGVTKGRISELTAAVDESLIGGFILQIGNTMVDASIAYDLNVIRKQFLNNDFIYKIR